ncbi:MAG: hypothetical protein QOH47_160 [Sphingomonadales bacterium]|jgi:hypothetical protein|nr:hypothetical protein [Sphingomonadales bacterium]
MRPIRLALPLMLLLGPGLAGAQPQISVPLPPAVPPPAPPRAPGPRWSEEMVAAFTAAREGERLMAAGQVDEAIQGFRRAVAAAPAGDARVHAVNGLHARMVGFLLIRAGRRDEADRELAWFLDRPRPGDPLADANVFLRLIDLRLYIRAGRGDISEVLALLESRKAFRGSPHAGCPEGPWFPDVVAPAHHDPRVAAALREQGCWDSIIAQLDEHAARPIGGNRFDFLPPRPPAPPP